MTSLFVIVNTVLDNETPKSRNLLTKYFIKNINTKAFLSLFDKLAKQEQITKLYSIVFRSAFKKYEKDSSFLLKLNDKLLNIII